jgi:hypothetical protein
LHRDIADALLAVFEKINDFKPDGMPDCLRNLGLFLKQQSFF